MIITRESDKRMFDDIYSLKHKPPEMRSMKNHVSSDSRSEAIDETLRLKLRFRQIEITIY